MTMTEYQDLAARLDLMQERIGTVACSLASLQGEVRATRAWSQIALSGAIAVALHLVIKALGGA